MSWFLCTGKHSSQSLGELCSMSLPSTACAPALCSWSPETVASLGCCCLLETYRSHQRFCCSCSLLARIHPFQSRWSPTSTSSCLLYASRLETMKILPGFSICVCSAVRWPTPGPFGRCCIAVHWDTRAVTWDTWGTLNEQWAVALQKPWAKMLRAMILGSFPYYPYRSFRERLFLPTL